MFTPTKYQCIKKRGIYMNFSTWLAIAVAIIVPTAMCILSNKDGK